MSPGANGGSGGARHYFSHQAVTEDLSVFEVLEMMRDYDLRSAPVLEGNAGRLDGPDSATLGGGGAGGGAGRPRLKKKMSVFVGNIEAAGDSSSSSGGKDEESFGRRDSTESAADQSR